MNTALVVSLLMSYFWSTDCIQTQANGMSGYVVDTMEFTQIRNSDNQTHVKTSRQWFKDAACSQAQTERTFVTGNVKLGNKLQEQNSVAVFEADWWLTDTNQIELGAIEVNSDANEVRVARGFGSGRNTMLSLFKFKPAEKPATK